MKSLQILSLAFAFVCFIACSKSSENASIIGRWKLTQTLADPGDGSGKWMPATSSYTIQFDRDSTAHSQVFSTGDPYLNRYSLPNDSTVILYYSDGSSLTLIYKIHADELTLTGGCIEACGSKYKRTAVLDL